MRTTFLAFFAFLVAPVLVLVCALSSRGAAAQALLPGFTESEVVTGLEGPTDIAFLSSTRLLVTEGDGTIQLVENGVASALVVIPTSFCTFQDFETGLLGIALDPDFANNGFIYLFRSVGSACAPQQNEVVRVTMAQDDTIDLDTLVVLLVIDSNQPFHLGGCLEIGPDNKLYVSVGDGWVGDESTSGPGTSTNPFAQNLAVLQGKILRLELDGSVPTDNPFVGQQGVREEIFAYGLRNPWRFDFDPQTDDLWVGDVGQDDFEEIDRIAAGSDSSWPDCEGKLPGGCFNVGENKPAFVYPHTGPKALGECVVGGNFAPDNFAFSGGAYFFADFDPGSLWRATLNKKRTALAGKIVAFANASRPGDVSFGPDGALYWTDVLGGRIVRISGPASGGGQALLGSSLKLGFGATDAKKTLSVQSSDVIDLGGGDDNPVNVGGSLRVAGTGFDTTYTLPAAHWKLTGKAPDKVTGFKYSDPKALDGPIKSVTVTKGKSIKIKGKGLGIGHVIGATDPGPVTVTLLLGGRTYCMNFGGTTTLKADKLFSALGAPAPSSCP